MYYKDGRYYKGQFIESKEYGKGQYLDINNNLIVGDFSDPEFIDVDFMIDINGEFKQN